MRIVSQRQAIVLFKVCEHPPKYKDKTAVIRRATYNNTAYCISMYIYICVQIFVCKYTCKPSKYGLLCIYFFMCICMRI